MTISLCLLLDISRSMKTKDILIDSNEIIDYFLLSPESNHEKFMLFLDEIKNEKKLTRGNASNLIAHIIKEETKRFVNEIAIGWYNSDAGVISNQIKKTYWFKLKNANIAELKALSLIFHRISKVATSGSDLSKGILKMTKIIGQRKNVKMIIITDGLWNVGQSPFQIIKELKGSVSIIYVNSNSEYEKAGLKEFVTLQKGQFIQISKLNRSSIEELESLKNWLLS